MIIGFTICDERGRVFHDSVHDIFYLRASYPPDTTRPVIFSRSQLAVWMRSYNRATRSCKRIYRAMIFPDTTFFCEFDKKWLRGEPTITRPFSFHILYDENAI